MRKQTAKFLSLILAASMALALLAGCGQKDASGSAAPKSSAAESVQPVSKEVVFGDAGGYFGATNLNPADSWNGWYLSFYGVGETLFRLDSNYNANPWLVESYETDGDLTWTFKLRDDVLFQNGEKMTAESVKKSLEYMMSYNERGPETFTIATIEADGQTLTITTTAPTPAFCRDLCDPLSVIQYIGDGIDYATAPVMTGPFSVSEFTAQEKCVLERFDDYWGGQPKLSKVTLLSMSDQDAVSMALQAGEIDMAVQLDAACLPQFTDTSKYHVSTATSTRGAAMCFNMDSKVVGDIAVRNAIAMSVDREGYCATTNGTFVPCYGLYSDIVSFGGTDGLDLKVTKYDIEGAKALLAEAGYADSNNDGVLDKNGKALDVTLLYNSGTPKYVTFAQMLQSDLKAVGINLVLNGTSDYKEPQKNGDFDIVLESYGMAPTGNFQYFLNIKFVTGASANFGHYSNAKVDELAKQMDATFDGGERDKLAKQITQQLLSDMYYCVYANQSFYCVCSNKITGFEAQPSEYYLLDKDIDIAE